MISELNQYNIHVSFSKIYGNKILHYNRKKLNQNKPIIYDSEGLHSFENKGQYIDMKI